MDTSNSTPPTVNVQKSSSTISVMSELSNLGCGDGSWCRVLLFIAVIGVSLSWVEMKSRVITAMEREGQMWCLSSYCYRNNFFNTATGVTTPPRRCREACCSRGLPCHGLLGLFFVVIVHRPLQKCRAGGDVYMGYFFSKYESHERYREVSSNVYSL